MSLRVLLLNWRDLHHPEAGGAEKYLVTVAEGLAARGHAVTFRTAAYPGALPDETVAGVRYLRRGGHYSIYPRALAATATASASHDVVVDVQNGVPYLSPLATRTPVVNLVHHVHREQWPVVFGPRAARARVVGGVPPRPTGVPQDQLRDRERLDPTRARRARGRLRAGHHHPQRYGCRRRRHRRDGHPSPRVVVLGRLVPQKRVELALDAVDRSARPSAGHPPGRRRVRAGGSPTCASTSQKLGIEGSVTFHGHVSEAEKHRLLSRAWVHAMPSLKEGWGLVVVEAGVHGTPTVAFRTAGGPADSIRDGETGLLVDDCRSQLPLG